LQFQETGGVIDSAAERLDLFPVRRVLASGQQQSISSSVQVEVAAGPGRLRGQAGRFVIRPFISGETQVPMWPKHGDRTELFLKVRSQRGRWCRDIAPVYLAVGLEITAAVVSFPDRRSS